MASEGKMVWLGSPGMVHRKGAGTADRAQGPGTDPDGPAFARDGAIAIAQIQTDPRFGLRIATGWKGFDAGRGERKGQRAYFLIGPVGFLFNFCGKSIFVLYL